MEDQARGLASQVEHRPQARPRWSGGRLSPPESKDASGESSAGIHRTDAEDRGRSRGPHEEDVPKPLLPLAREHREDGSDSSEESLAPSCSGWNFPSSKKRVEVVEGSGSAAAGISQKVRDATRLLQRQTDFDRAFEDYGSDPIGNARRFAGHGGGMLRSVLTASRR